MLKITIELDDKQKEAQILTLLLGGASATTAEPAKKPAAKQVAGEEEEEEKPTKKAKAAPAKAAAAKKKDGNLSDDEFESYSEEEQFEAFKVIATRHSKKGKTADIKQILEKHGVARMTELEPEQYLAFYQDVVRYDEGEDIDDIIADDSEI